MSTPEHFSALDPLRSASLRTFDAPLASDAAFDALPADDVLDAHLSRLLASAPPCPAPAGFTQRVMAALPPLAAAPVDRPQRARAVAAPARRPKWSAAAVLALVLGAVAVGRVAGPGFPHSEPTAAVSAAEVAQARANVELAFALLGEAQHKAEAQATDILSR